MKIYLEGSLRKLPNNFRMSFGRHHIFLGYIYQTKLPKNTLFLSTLDDKPQHVYEIAKVTNSSKIISKRYIEYSLKIDLYDLKSGDSLTQIIYEAYYKLKKAAMLDARLLKTNKLLNDISKCTNDKKIKNLKNKLNKYKEEIEYLKNIEDGKPFGAYVFTEEYKFNCKRLADLSRPILYDPINDELPF